MLVNPFTSVVSSTLSGAKSPASKLEKAVDQLSSSQPTRKVAENVPTDNTASQSVASNLQNKVSNLRAALTSTSQFESLAQTADNGVAQIQDRLGQLQALAAESTKAQDELSRSDLQTRFQGLVEEIDRIAENTQFNGTQLLNGNLAGENTLDIGAALGENPSSDDALLAVESLRSADLLGEGVNISTQENADQALTVIQQALNSVGTTRASIGNFAEQVDYASAYVETAIANQDAARATLSDEDFTSAATILSRVDAKDNAESLVRAQSTRLPPSLVELVQ